MKTLFDFQSPDDAWSNIDDVVMGGVSSSRMRVSDGKALFEGVLSLENRGGFASVRSRVLPMDLEGYEGVLLRVKGDGKKYQFRVRTSSTFDGPSYRADFVAVSDDWTEVRLPLSQFIATFRGRELADYPPIEAGKIATMGFLIADKQEGAFRLEIDWVKGY